MAISIDGMIENDSLKAGGQDYLTITSLSTRQAFGATQLEHPNRGRHLPFLPNSPLHGAVDDKAHA